MPRHRIEPAHTVESLSILNEDNELDEALEPDIPDDLLLRMYRTMVLCRRFDERMLSLQRQGKLGTFGPTRGQEASQIGAAATLRDDDWVVPSYRETCVAIWRGIPLSGLLLYNAGYNEGGRIPDDRNDLPIAIPVGTQMLHAVGIGYGLNMRNEDRVVLTCFGDGATSQGDFHEAMNFASVFKTPVVFLCQNNQWAISVPRDQQTASQTLAQKALSYGMHGIQVDGNDILAVYAAVSEAMYRARAEREPTMIECVTYRMSVHTTADDPTKYRSAEEVEKWEKRDPIRRFQYYMKQKKLISDDDIGGIDEEVKNQVAQSWDEAQQMMEDLQDPLRIFDHVYADLPPYVALQREYLKSGLSAKSKGAQR